MARTGEIQPIIHVSRLPPVLAEEQVWRWEELILPRSEYEQATEGDQPIPQVSRVKKSVAVGPLDAALLAQWRATLAETVPADEMAGLMGFSVYQNVERSGPYVVWAHLERTEKESGEGE